MKIASWNVNSLNVRLPHLEQWLRGFAPDVVGLQETKLEDARFPVSCGQAGELARCDRYRPSGGAGGFVVVGGGAGEGVRTGYAEPATRAGGVVGEAMDGGHGAAGRGAGAGRQADGEAGQCEAEVGAICCSRQYDCTYRSRTYGYCRLLNGWGGCMEVLERI
ncbi:endonuclease/exonuclease/phosphatase family protein [Stenotrophomonas sp. MMGLT7]|nr:endonuclease/exonuclease/phosphatase family protein [Stenotrophomonas sp. MMGLT7]